MSVSEHPLRKRIRDHYSYLTEELIPSLYVGELFQEQVLSKQEKEELSALDSNRYEQAKRFVDALLHKPESNIKTFLDIVKKARDKQPHIYWKIFPEIASSEEPRSSRVQRQGSFSFSRGVACDIEETSGKEEDPEWEEIVIPHLPVVVDALLPSELLNDLRARQLLSRKEYRQLQQEVWTDKQRSEMLVHDILPSKGRGSFLKFCEVLLDFDNQRHIVVDILKQRVSSPCLLEEKGTTHDRCIDSVVEAATCAVPTMPTVGNCSLQATPVSLHPEFGQRKLGDDVRKTVDVLELVKQAIYAATGDSGNVVLQGRRLHYEVKGGFYKWEYQYTGKAWDEQTQISMKSKRCKSSSGAREHVLEDLVTELRKKGFLK